MADMAETYFAGYATAYGAAKRGGYAGTYAEFCAEQAKFGDNARLVAEAREAVTADLTQFEGDLEAFESETLPDAVSAVEQAGESQAQAVQAAGLEQIGKVEDTGAAQIAAVTAVGNTQAQNVTAEGTRQIGLVQDAGTTQKAQVTEEGDTQIARVQAKGDVVIDSIPEDYTGLTGKVTDLESAFDEVTQTVYSANFFDGAFPQTGSINNTGEEIASSLYVRTDYIPVESGTIYFLREISPYIVNVRFYDDGKNYISGGTAFAANVQVLRSQFAIPASAAYVRLVRPAAATGYICMSYIYLDDYVAPGYSTALKDETVSWSNLTPELQSRISNNLPLANKTIVFLGDSIIGNFYDDTGVCATLAEKTGATVINGAFGGSRMAYRYGNNQQYRYWDALSGTGLANAIATGNWDDQEEAVANMTGALAYFQNRLDTLMSVDWATVDILMWEYGTNDFATYVMLSDASDQASLFAYDNAYRHAIETILTAYPHLRVVPVTPIWRWFRDSDGEYLDDSNSHETPDYNGTSRLLTDFVSAAQSVSKEYQLPCIDNYYTLGANQFTRLTYFDATDGAHPNAQGRERIASHIASQLLSLL